MSMSDSKSQAAVEYGISNDFRRISLKGKVLVIHQPEFMPWLGLISKAAMGDCYLIWDTDQFKKENFQNRNRIRFKNELGWVYLVVPVTGAKTRIMNMTEVKIHNNGVWQNKLLKTIRHSYGKAPFFPVYFPELRDILLSQTVYLHDLNVKIIEWALRMFQVKVPVYRVSNLQKNGLIIQGMASDAIISMCKFMGADNFVFGVSGRTYYEPNKFVKARIRPVFQDFTHPVYTQIHGGFVPNMSFIDLLFNHGPKSVEILGGSQFKEK